MRSSPVLTLMATSLLLAVDKQHDKVIRADKIYFCDMVFPPEVIMDY